MRIIKTILLNILLIGSCYSEEQTYTKSGIPIKFYDLLDINNVSYSASETADPNSIIELIKAQERQLFKDGAYISPSR
jgi:hypothetical protein